MPEKPPTADTGKPDVVVRAQKRGAVAMIIALGTTGPTPDPPPVEIAADEALLVNAGAYRVVIKGDGSMHVHVCPVCGQQADPVPDNERPTTLGEVLDGPDIYSVVDYERAR